MTKSRFQKDRTALISLIFLGMIAGFLYKIGGPLMRHWAREQGLTPKSMDPLNSFELISALRFFWMPFLSLPLTYGRLKNRRLWLVIMLCLCLVFGMGLHYTSFLSTAFWIFLLLFTLARNSFDSLVVACQMESIKPSSWGLGEQFSLIGYRIAMTTTVSLSLLASNAGRPWQSIYGVYWWTMAIFIVLLSTLPFLRGLNHVADTAKSAPSLSLLDNYRLTMGSLKEWIHEKGSKWTLATLFFYQSQDALLHPNKEWFLRDMGVSKTMLAALQPFAIAGGILGGFLAALMIRRKGHFYALTFALIAHSVSGLLLSWGSFSGLSPFHFCILGVVEQLTHDQSQVALYAFQMLASYGAQGSITRLTFLAVCSDFGLRIIGLRSGWIQNHYGWTFLTALGPLCLPFILYMIAQTYRTTDLSQKTMV